jgi:hypothetical protein
MTTGFIICNFVSSYVMLTIVISGVRSVNDITTANKRCCRELSLLSLDVRCGMIADASMVCPCSNTGVVQVLIHCTNCRQLVKYLTHDGRVGSAVRLAAGRIAIEAEKQLVLRPATPTDIYM